MKRPLPPSSPDQLHGQDDWLSRLTRFVLGHRKVVVAFWVIVTIVGIASTSSATKALSDQYSIPGREGYDTNALITHTFGNGGDSPPLVAVVTLPKITSIDSTQVRSGLTNVASRIERAVPHARVASFASTGDRAFVSADGHTTFVVG
jgi:RND superfamily putative drug exporter